MEKPFAAEASVNVLNLSLLKARKALNAERLAQIKRKIAADLVYVNDNPQTAANWIGYMLSAGFGLEDVQNYEEKINAVTLDEVIDAYNNLLQAPDITAILLPQETDKGGRNE